jgi:2'-5' RNA ligase
MTELSSNFEEAWDRFRGARSLRLLQETLEWEWTRGRREYAAFLIEVEDAAVRQHISRIIERLGSIPGVDPYPDTYWHITVKGIGFVVDQPSQPDEVSPRQVAEFGAKARAMIEATPQFAVTVGPPNGFPEVVMLEVEDGGATGALNDHLTGSMDGLPVYPVDGPSLLPHISIARFSSQEGLSSLKDTLAELRADAGAGPSFTVGEVRLIQAHLAEAAPTFDTLASYRLKSDTQ